MTDEQCVDILSQIDEMIELTESLLEECDK